MIGIFPPLPSGRGRTIRRGKKGTNLPPLDLSRLSAQAERALERAVTRSGHAFKAICTTLRRAQHLTALGYRVAAFDALPGDPAVHRAAAGSTLLRWYYVGLPRPRKVTLPASGRRITVTCHLVDLIRLADGDLEAQCDLYCETYRRHRICCHTEACLEQLRVKG